MAEYLSDNEVRDKKENDLRGNKIRCKSQFIILNPIDGGSQKYINSPSPNYEVSLSDESQMKEFRGKMIERYRQLKNHD